MYPGSEATPEVRAQAQALLQAVAAGRAGGVGPQHLSALANLPQLSGQPMAHQHQHAASERRMVATMLPDGSTRLVPWKKTRRGTRGGRKHRRHRGEEEEEEDGERRPSRSEDAPPQLAPTVLIGPGAYQPSKASAPLPKVPASSAGARGVSSSQGQSVSTVSYGDAQASADTHTRGGSVDGALPVPEPTPLLPCRSSALSLPSQADNYGRRVAAFPALTMTGAVSTPSAGDGKGEAARDGHGLAVGAWAGHHGVSPAEKAQRAPSWGPGTGFPEATTLAPRPDSAWAGLAPGDGVQRWTSGGSAAPPG